MLEPIIIVGAIRAMRSESFRESPLHNRMVFIWNDYNIEHLSVLRCFGDRSPMSYRLILLLLPILKNES